MRSFNYRLNSNKENYVKYKVNIANVLKLQHLGESIENLPIGPSETKVFIFRLTNDDIKVALEKKSNPKLISWQSLTCYVIKFTHQNKAYALKIPKDSNNSQIIQCFDNEERVYRRLRFL